MDNTIKKLAIFASGKGTNAQNFISFFSKNRYGKVSIILTDRKDAPVIERCEKLGVKVVVFSTEELNNGIVLEILEREKIDFIVLAGFLKMIPLDILERYHNHIVNIHPSLLPRYGGRGMYGMNVHRAVIENQEKESGITIHRVSEICDDGAIIFQACVRVDSTDTPESLASKISQLEMEHYPRVVESLLKIDVI